MALLRHRKLMMKVNQQLGSEEFYSLAYLMCVPDEIAEATQSDHDRTRILRYLEKQNIIGPHNYHCLVDALDTLGRCDLIMQIALEDPEGVVAKLPYIPQSIQPQQLAWLAKRESIVCKKEKYIGCMKDLDVFMQSETALERIFCDQFLGVFSALTSEQDQIPPQYQERAAATLTELSLFWKRWPTIGATFVHANGSTSKIEPIVSECHSCFDRFNCELPPSWEIDLRKNVLLHRTKTQHPIGKFAQEAQSIIQELSAELIEEHLPKKASKKTQEELFVLESCHYVTESLIPICKWLITLIYSTSLPTTDASKISATLKVILSDHYEDIARNRDILVGIVGEEIMDRISQELLQDKHKDSNTKCDIDIPTYTTFTSSVSVVWHVTLVTLAMMSLNYTVDHRAIQQKLVEFFVSQRRTLMQIHSQLMKRDIKEMQKVLDHYKEICKQKISELVGEASESLDVFFNC